MSDEDYCGLWQWVLCVCVFVGDTFVLRTVQDRHIQVVDKYDGEVGVGAGRRSNIRGGGAHCANNQHKLVCVEGEDRHPLADAGGGVRQGTIRLPPTASLKHTTTYGSSTTRLLLRSPCVLPFRRLYLYDMQLGGQAPTFLGQLKALSYVPLLFSITRTA
jgi:hypothetical protein